MNHLLLRTWLVLVIIKIRIELQPLLKDFPAERTASLLKILSHIEALFLWHCLAVVGHGNAHVPDTSRPLGELLADVRLARFSLSQPIPHRYTVC